MKLSRHARRSLIAAASALLIVVSALLIFRNATTSDALSRLERVGQSGGRSIYEGSWHFPRHGPYKVGFYSPGGEARLFIDGALVVRGRGLSRQVREPWPPPRVETARKPYHPGVVAVRFEAPPGARLLWVPAGRRGDPEYVPPSSLSPEPPGQARFDAPGTFRRDGVIALLIGLTILGLTAFLLRAQIHRLDRREALWVGGVFVLALGVRLYGLGAAGQTWDEDVNWAAGRNYVQNLVALDFDQSAWIWNYQHPPVMKYVAGFGAQWSDSFGPARAMSALMVALACALLVPIGRRLFSLRVGVLAGAVAAFTPHIIAHSKVVGHEAPTMLWWTLGLWLCLGAFDEEPDRRRLIWRFAAIGVVLGIAIMSRFVNALMAPMIGCVLLLQAPPDRRKETLVLGISVIPLVAIAASFLIWPRLWSSPIAHLSESWDKLKQPHAFEPFLGSMTNRPPRYYFFAYLVATAPVGILLGAATGLVRLSVWRERSSWIAAALLVAPLLVLLSPVRQDGVRYIMPSLLAMALLCAAGLDYVAHVIASRVKRLSKPTLFDGIGAGLVLYLVIVCLRIHPYYLDYYGELYGGPAGVSRNKSFETAWWGEGLHEAIDYINREAPPGARVFKACVEPAHLAWMRGDLWPREARRPADADWFLQYAPRTRPCPIPPNARLVFEARAQGAPLARVYRR